MSVHEAPWYDGKMNWKYSTVPTISRIMPVTSEQMLYLLAALEARSARSMSPAA